MSKTGITTLDHAPDAVAEWLIQLSEWMGWTETGKSYLLLRSTLHELRDYLSVDEAAQLAAQMPLLMKGIFYDGWNPAHKPGANHDKTSFIRNVQEKFIKYPLDDPEGAISTVFALLETKISMGEIGDVRGAMKKELQELWP